MDLSGKPNCFLLHIHHTLPAHRWGLSTTLSSSLGVPVPPGFSTVSVRHCLATVSETPQSKRSVTSPCSSLQVPSAYLSLLSSGDRPITRTSYHPSLCGILCYGAHRTRGEVHRGYIERSILGRHLRSTEPSTLPKHHPLCRPAHSAHYPGLLPVPTKGAVAKASPHRHDH